MRHKLFASPVTMLEWCGRRSRLWSRGRTGTAYLLRAV